MRGRVAAIVQARMGSTRLPGKVLERIGGFSALEILIRRLQKSRCLDAIVVATTVRPIDDPIVALAERCGADWYRGDEEDVLGRYLGAADAVGAAVIVRVTADNPLTDLELMEDLVRHLVREGCDYAAVGGVILGLGSEVFTHEALARAEREGREVWHREHVTPYLYEHPDLFRIAILEPPASLKRDDIRLTIDDPRDLQVFQALASHLPDLVESDRADILAVLDSHPGIAELNRAVRQRHYRQGERQRVVFVTDGGKEMGMGHLFRALTLAGELSGCEYDILFIVRGDGAVTELIGQRGFSCIIRDRDAAIVRALEGIRPDLIVIDRYILEETFTREMRECTEAKILIFDNTTAANEHADMVVNALADPGFRNLAAVDAGGRRYFQGPKYLILSSDFDTDAESAPGRPGSIRRILISFGGSDPLNLTTRAVEELDGEDVSIQVVLGPLFGYREALSRTLEERRGSVEVVQNRSLAELIRAADAVVTHPGLTMFEALALGRPVALLCQNDMQREVYREFFSRYGGSPIGPLWLSGARYIHPANTKDLEIGRGKGEIVTEIHKYLRASNNRTSTT